MLGGYGALRLTHLRGPTHLPPWAANRRVGRFIAASIGRSFNPRACPRKDFHAVFFLGKLFRNSVSFNVAEACVYSGAPAAKLCAGRVPPPQLLRRKISSCRKRNSRKRVAFGLPQDSPDELMFEACVNCMSELSAFRGVGFHVERRVAGAAHRRRMRCKRLNRRPNLHARTSDCSRMFLKRFHRHGFPQQTTRSEAAKSRRLPPFRRNVPKVCRMTSPARASSDDAP